MAGLLSKLLQALGRKPKGRYAPSFAAPALQGEHAERIERERRRRLGGASQSALPSVAQPKAPPPYGFELTPDDAEFLMELGMAPEDVTSPYVVPEMTEPVVEEAVAQHVLSGDWTHVASSNVDAFRFREPYDAIDVKFLSGAIYSYHNCGRAEALRFYESPSAGKFVWYVFRANPGKYPFTKLRDADRTKKVNPRTGKGYVVFKPKRRWMLHLGGKRRKR